MRERIEAATTPAELEALERLIVESEYVAEPETVGSDRIAVQREKRLSARDLAIPVCKNPERRAIAESSTRDWLATYGPSFYRRELSPQINTLIDAYEQVLSFGGDQAVAATRGIGKSTLVSWLTVCFVMRGMLDCVLILAQNGEKASQNMANIKAILLSSKELGEDYPEVLTPVRDVRGAPQKGMSQTVGGVNTEIQWSSLQIVLPKIPGFAGAGAVIASLTIDSGNVRGFNHEGKRPKVVVLDDPETRESAASDKEIENREQIIEADVAELGTPERPVARLMLTTIQNRKSISWAYTDPVKKPSWNGKRFAFLKTWPDRKDLWDRYVNQRRREQQAGDRYSRGAHSAYLENREEMDAGAVCENDLYDRRQLPDGTQVQVSALQRLYDVIADRGEDGFRHVLSEWQNDPPEDEAGEAGDLTPEIVASRVNGIPRGTVPDDVETLVIQIDLHNAWHYWTALATSRNGTVRDVVDYGLHNVPVDAELTTDNAIALALDQLCDELTGRDWITTEGRIVPLDLVMIDAGYKQEVGLSLITERKGLFRLSKGRENGKNLYKSPKETGPNAVKQEHWYDGKQEACEDSNGKQWWLVFADTDYWMHQLHSAFAAALFDESGVRQEGSIGLFGDDPDVHLSPVDRQVARSAFATQICGWLWQSRESKRFGSQMDWIPQWKQDHWLDTTYGCLVGDLVVRRYHPRFRVVKPAPPKPEPKRFTMPDGRPYLLTERR